MPFLLLSLIFFGSATALGCLNQVFSVGGVMREYAFPFAVVISFVATFGLSEGNRLRRFGGTCVALLALTAVFALSSLYMDFSLDGQAYHQRAVGALLNGIDFIKNDTPTDNLWTNHYTKATWYYATTLVNWFGRSDLGSSYHLVLAMAAGACAYRFCRWAQRREVLSGVLALLIALNPISILQMYTYYNDAPLGSLGVILFLSAIMMVRESKTRDKVVFVLSAIMVINVKSSGFILVGSAFLYIFIAHWTTKKRPIPAMAATLRPFAIFCVFGIAILGYSPFMQNITHGRNFFYPLAGANAVDIITGNAPYGFPEHGRFRNLIVSVFSQSANIASASHGTQAPILKIPGSVTTEELDTFIFTDIRIGGFGPLFSLLLIASLGVLMAFRMNWMIAGPLYFMVLLAIAINPHAWWARYTPVMWLLPIIPVIAMLKPRFSLAWAFPLACILIAVTNVGLILYKWLGHYPVANAMVEVETKPLQGKMLKVYAGPYYIDLSFKRMGLKGEEVTEEYYKANKEKFLPLWSGIEYEKQ